MTELPDRPIPVVTRTAYGAWFMSTPADYRFRIATMGATRAEGLRLYREMIDLWEGFSTPRDDRL